MGDHQSRPDEGAAPTQQPDTPQPGGASVQLHHAAPSKHLPGNVEEDRDHTTSCLVAALAGGAVRKAQSELRPPDTEQPEPSGEG